MKKMISEINSLQFFGIDFFCLRKKFLVANMVSRNLKIKYRRSFLGAFWTVLAPMMGAAVYYYAFKVVARVQLPYYLAFVVSGVLPWSFFAQTILESMESLVTNQSLLTKVPIPLQVFPYVGALTNLVTLLTAIPVVLGICLITGVPVQWTWLEIPLYYVLLFLISYLLSLSLAIGYVYLRDLKHAMTFVIQAWLYATPVLYASTMIPEKYKFTLLINPIAFIFVGMRDAIFATHTLTQSEWLVGIGWLVFFFFSAVFLIRKFSKHVVERL